MYLQKLEIQGFKSFAQKTTFVFPAPTVESRGITAVIGPNGSGKSNIADAIRWVLGEQSMKLLRSKKSEDVIFFGSDKKAQQGFCEVSLFFNNEDKMFPLEYAEVILTRRLYRSGESEYMINKSKVRLADISLLIAQASIGQRSYSVIGQGMIDSIINTPPSERKEFFQDAAGVRPYQIKKDSAVSKLKATRQNLLQANILLHELEPKMKFFQRQLKRLEEREGVERELQELLRMYYNNLWNELNHELEARKAQRATINAELAEKTADYEKLSAAFREQEQHSNQQDVSRMGELQRERARLASEKQHLVSQLTVIDGRLQLEFEKIGETQLALLQQRITDLRHREERLNEEGRSIQQEQLQRKTNAGEIEKEFLAKEQELRDLELSVKELEGSVSEITPKTIHSELKELHVFLREKHEDEREDWLTQRMEEIERRLEILIEKIERAVSKKHPEHSEQRQQVTILKQELEKVIVRQQALKVEIGITDHRIAALEDEQVRCIHERERAEKDLALNSHGSTEEKRTTLLSEREVLAQRLIEIEPLLQKIEADINGLYGKEQEAHKQLLSLQKAMAALQRDIDTVKDRLSSLDQERARSEAHQEDLLRKIIEELRVSREDEQELLTHLENVVSLLGFSQNIERCDRSATRESIDHLKRKLEQIGTIDPDIVNEYENTKERYEFLSQQVGDLSSAIESLGKAIRELDAIMRQKFDTSLKHINTCFELYFKQLFDGGTAHLIIQRKERIEGEEEESVEEAESYDDEIAGIEIEATPPGKKFKSISFLSGGEKALTAVSLLCAILSTNPSPFVVLDEIDAALDESNANRLAEILQELALRTQFIVVTHNRVTMHIGKVLYGITMGEDGISKALSLDIRLMSATMAS